jgi:hypothetical protein
MPIANFLCTFQSPKAVAPFTRLCYKLPMRYPQKPASLGHLREALREHVQAILSAVLRYPRKNAAVLRGTARTMLDRKMYRAVFIT